MGKSVIGAERSCRPFPSCPYCKTCCWNRWISKPLHYFELVSDNHSAPLSYNKQVYCFHAFILSFRAVYSKLVSCRLTETLVDAKEGHDFCMFCITMGICYWLVRPAYCTIAFLRTVPRNTVNSNSVADALCNWDLPQNTKTWFTVQNFLTCPWILQQKSLNVNLWTLRNTTRIFAFKFLVSSSQETSCFSSTKRNLLMLCGEYTRM